MDVLAEQECTCELAELPDATRRNTECVQREANAVAEVAIVPNCILATPHFFVVFETATGCEAVMAQSIKAVDVAVGNMDAARAFLANVEVEDDT